MEWYQAYSLINAGQRVRLPQWEDGKFICELEDRKDNKHYLIDQNSEEYKITEDELTSSDWECVDEIAVGCDDYTNTELHYRVNLAVMSKLIFLKNKLNQRLIYFSEKHNTVPNWDYQSNLKYYLVFSHINDEYSIVGTWAHYHLGNVYFQRKSDCELALTNYRYLIDEVVQLEKLYGKLHHDKFERDELVKFYKKYC